MEDEILSKCVFLMCSYSGRWDFAGDGYVHRLILNSEETALDHTTASDSCTDSIDIVGCSSFRGSTDSLLNTDIFGRASTKIVEVVDPRLSQDDFGLFLYLYYSVCICMYVFMYVCIYIFLSVLKYSNKCMYLC